MGKFTALPSNIRLEWKWLTVKNTLAYYFTELIPDVKRFYNTCAVKSFCVQNFYLFVVMNEIKMAPRHSAYDTQHNQLIYDTQRNSIEIHYAECH
jgi:hypothetical protein